MHTDFYEANNDWSGNRNLIKNTHELVEYKNNSSVRIWYNEQAIDYDSHWHTALEIIMPVENYYDVIVNQVTYHIVPGDILLIPPKEIHSLTAPTSGSRLIYLFDITLLMKLKGFTGIQPLLVESLFITYHTFPQIYHNLYHILVHIRDEYFSKNEYSELMITSLLLNFFIQIGYNHIHSHNLFLNTQPPRQREYVQKFNNLLEYIDEHYTENLTLKDVASYCGFSKFHFSRLFKQYTSYTYNDYLNNLIIKAAAEMLADPDLSITEIAMRSGFSSISTFNRLFKQTKHCTPGEFRMLYCATRT